MPFWGSWNGEFRIDSQDAIEGAVTIKIGSSTLQGWTVRSGVFSANNWLRVVAGKGGLWQTELKAVGFRDATVKNVLDAICSSSGEVLSKTISSDVLSKRLPFWSIIGGHTGTQTLNYLAKYLDLAWRSLDDGTVWLGSPTYTNSPAPIDADTEELNASRQWAHAIVGTTELFPRPATIWNNRKVDKLVFHMEGDSLRSEVFYGS